MSNAFWIAMYCALVGLNVFFAWLALRGVQPFRARWQIVVWHICLALECVGAALYLNAKYGIEIYRLALRLAWLGALIVMLIVVGQWVWIGFRQKVRGGL